MIDLGERIIELDYQESWNFRYMWEYSIRGINWELEHNLKQESDIINFTNISLIEMYR